MKKVNVTSIEKKLKDLKKYSDELAEKIKKGGSGGEWAKNEMWRCFKSQGLVLIRYRIGDIYIKNPGRDMEIYNDSILALLRAIESCRPIKDIPSYLRGIIIKKCIDALHQQDHVMEPPDENGETLEPAIPEEVEECLEYYSIKQPLNWHIFDLHYIQGYTYAEIGLKVAMNEGAVRKRVFGFRQRLTKCVEIKLKRNKSGSGTDYITKCIFSITIMFLFIFAGD